jgi:hypothetical protein
MFRPRVNSQLISRWGETTYRIGHDKVNPVGEVRLGKIRLSQAKLGKVRFVLVGLG